MKIKEKNKNIDISKKSVAVKSETTKHIKREYLCHMYAFMNYEGER